MQEKNKILADATVRDLLTCGRQLKGKRLTPLEQNLMDVYQRLNILDYSNSALNLSLREVQRYISHVSENFITIHRVNYAAWNAILELCDYLDEKQLLRFGAKKAYKKMQVVFGQYAAAHRAELSEDTWWAFQDYMRIANDAVLNAYETLQGVIRDYLIMHRDFLERFKQPSDILLVTKAAVSLILMRVVRASYLHYIEQTKEESGIGFNGLLAYADLAPIENSLMELCRAVGVRLEVIPGGMAMLQGYSEMDKNSRYASALRAYIDNLRDAKLLDDAQHGTIVDE